MTTTLGLQLTPGQRCLLDLLQRKLLNTIQSYARLSLEKQKALRQTDELDNELFRLKEKIRRISARQKRFTLEIINGNGNNTIPKESFFQALGLVTKEALNKLNSKTNERRRRTTANPRFSHEAIQAKRALEPLQKRLEPRGVRDNNKRETQASSRRQQSRSSTNNNSYNQSNNNIIDSNGNNNNNNSRTNNNINSKGPIQQAALNGARASSQSAGGRQSRQNQLERKELLYRFERLQNKINSRVSQIKDKQESNRKLERENELIRKRGLDIISAINMINPDLKLHDAIQDTTNDTTDNNNHNNNNNTTTTEKKFSQQGTTEEGKEQNINMTQQQNNNDDQSTQPNVPASLDIWIDMKCDESLDGLD